MCTEQEKSFPTHQLAGNGGNDKSWRRTGETFSIAWGGAVPFSAWREEVLKASQCREKKVQGGL